LYKYKFNGKELDEETGLYYYGARYYDPRISIWLSVHPLAERHPKLVRAKIRIASASFKLVPTSK
jgi:RHS repeat-associated protein